MSEPIAERLIRFTPDAAGLSREALLFAAGRASARPNRRWKVLAAALCVSQVLTLVSLWPHSPAAPSAPLPLVEQESVPCEDTKTLLNEDAPESDWYDRLMTRILSRPAPADKESLVPDPPPLRAFDPPPSTILN